jgi:AcrR family transcriptional regulator
MAGRPRLASDEQILEAVARGIGRYGPRELTLAHIAEDLGLAPATLVQRFGSKRGLFVALAARGTDAVAAVFERARAAAPTALDGLRQALTDRVSGIGDRAVMANNVAMLALDLADDELGAHATHQARGMRDQVRRFLADAAERGELVGADVDELADVVLAVYNGALVTWAIDGSGDLPGWLGRRLDAVLRPYRAGRAGR